MKSSASEPFLTEEAFLWTKRGKRYQKNNKRFRKQLLLQSFIAPLLLNIIGIKCRKIPKINPGAYIFQSPFLRGLYTEGSLRFKID